MSSRLISAGLLCLQCGINASLGKRSARRCRHATDGLSRSFVSTYSSIDYAYGAELSYRYFFYEIIAFEGVDKALEKYMSLMLCEKFRQSGYPSKDWSQCQKEAYLQELNREMSFGELLGEEKLTTENVAESKYLADIGKGNMNKFIGMFSYNKKKNSSFISYVNSHSELAKRVKSKRIVHLEDFGQAIQVTEKSTRSPVNRKGNVMVSSSFFSRFELWNYIAISLQIGVLVHAYARVHIHRQIMKIVANGGRIYRQNCDSLIFSLPADKRPEDIGIQVSKLPGAFKHEIRNITSLAQISMNMCSILHNDDDGVEVATMKCGGVNLNANVSAFLSHNAFVEAVEAAARGDREAAAAAEIKVPNVRSSKRKLRPMKTRTEITIRMKSALVRRQLDPKPELGFRTLPWGFLENSQHKHTNPYKQ